MFGIGLGIIVFGYWRLFKWNRERRQDSFGFCHSAKCAGLSELTAMRFCAADACRLKRWKPG